MIIILGAGLSGLSCSHHIGHDKCLILEGRSLPFGHAKSWYNNGVVWDEGPHVSFTKNEYVKDLQKKSVIGQYHEFSANISNYYHGAWMGHPAQTSLFNLPEPLRADCVKSFVENRARIENDSHEINNYQDWLEEAFGPVFAENFAGVYTKKYWTREASKLSTDWIGSRIYRPEIEDVISGAKSELKKNHHYIDRFRYPLIGGFQSFARNLYKGSRVQFGEEVNKIYLKEKRILTKSGKEYTYDTLINTLPLPAFLEFSSLDNKQFEGKEELSCTELLLINIVVPHEHLKNYHWIYVYDSNKLTTRISFPGLLSPNNIPERKCAIQVEVYFSRYNPRVLTVEEIASQVIEELKEMKLIVMEKIRDNSKILWSSRFIPWANIIFDKETEYALEQVWSSLEEYGLVREKDDTKPLGGLGKLIEGISLDNSLIMAGRYGQWKYFWSDDCILRGKQISESLMVK